MKVNGHQENIRAVIDRVLFSRLTFGRGSTFAGLYGLFGLGLGHQGIPQDGIH